MLTGLFEHVRRAARLASSVSSLSGLSAHNGRGKICNFTNIFNVKSWIAKSDDIYINEP